MQRIGHHHPIKCPVARKSFAGRNVLPIYAHTHAYRRKRSGGHSVWSIPFGRDGSFCASLLVLFRYIFLARLGLLQQVVIISVGNGNATSRERPHSWLPFSLPHIPPITIALVCDAPNVLCAGNYYSGGCGSRCGACPLTVLLTMLPSPFPFVSHTNSSKLLSHSALSCGGIRTLRQTDTEE
ncbi:hypothetical protein M404DRAFT_778814 [Pisolithus tinctorius Marx 270]|uniref:Uncharacterized protein n=1 Tax=Pisolithus tinctorius Marx 270 TaxID=870435 RepID=A0A0C3NXG7_PISTI|nr:hypothetical protein M404DRAFT_778814 [Pisolithus tinctorius Marx 270]